MIPWRNFEDYSRYQRLLLKRALGPAGTGAALLAKVQAIDALAKDAVPVPMAQIKAHLDRFILVSEEFGTYQAQRAASMAPRLLAWRTVTSWSSRARRR